MPNTVEFGSAFKKLLVCHPLTTSIDHNVISNATGILTISYALRHKTLPPHPGNQPLELHLEIDFVELMVQEMDSMDDFDQHVME